MKDQNALRLPHLTSFPFHSSRNDPSLFTLPLRANLHHPRPISSAVGHMHFRLADEVAVVVVDFGRIDGVRDRQSLLTSRGDDFGRW
jgi:hypothetical protein